MAVRVTAILVKQIMDGCVVSDEDVDAFIVAANLLVNKVFADDTTTGEALLTEIEKWYSAHLLACTRHRTTKEEEIGDAKVKFTGTFGRKLDSTPYGQVVAQLDVSGKMGKVGKLGATVYAIESFD